jgi:prepilin peptidase CpaA
MARLLIVALGLAAAVVIDVRTRRIPNPLTAGMALAGVGLAIAGAGLTPLQALFGVLVGLAVMMPAHLIGATGAGDVKLVAAIGSLDGPALALKVCLYSAVAGGGLAVLVAAQRGVLSSTLYGARQLVMAPAGTREAIESSSRANRFAYAPAIAAGTFAALVLG